MFDVVIYLSCEDDMFNVLGGIGTYTGICAREVKRLQPKSRVIWVTKSHDNSEFDFIDDSGVERYYLNEVTEYTKLPFMQYVDNAGDDAVRSSSFRFKVTKKVLDLLEQVKGKKVLIEAGEFEGLGASLFKIVDDQNVTKACRLHTPLVTCLKQNNLTLNTKNSLQMIKEYRTIVFADVVTSPTDFVKRNVIADVLGKKHVLCDGIEVIPNPINTDTFGPKPEERIKSIAYLNKVLNRDFFTPETINVYILGSVETRKGAELVIDSVPKSIDGNPNLRFCFIGRHGAEDGKSLNSNTKLTPKQLLARIPKKYREKVAFTDYFEYKKLPFILQGGDLFPIMSLGDNFPGTVAEISLTSKPVLALMRGGVKEMLTSPKGKVIAYGLGSELSGASDKLAKGLIELSRDKNKADTIGSHLRELMLSEYTPARVLTQMLSHYEENGR